MKRVGKIRVDTKYTAQEWGRGHYRVKPLAKLFLKTEKLRRGTVGGNELNYWNNLHEKQKKRKVCEGSNGNEEKRYEFSDSWSHSIQPTKESQRNPNRLITNNGINDPDLRIQISTVEIVIVLLTEKRGRSKR